MFRDEHAPAGAAHEEEHSPAATGSEIAIIAMACRFPGAETPEAFWRNVREGVESLTELSDEELRAAGVTAEEMADPGYVRRASVIAGIEDFDAAFFGYTPLEVTIMDPQQRLFLECAWEVFERGGYDPEAYPRPVGVFTGAKTNTYLFHVVAQRDRFPALDNFQIALGNDLAAMATRVSYKLDLRGPSYGLHTACSTSLVAVHLACQSLLLDECAMAVAGGAAINVPQRRGYPYQKGGILSPDGSCRTFDAGAAGSNFGNGVGAVLLKRLDDALADGDPIHAVIRGSATNNDGAAKASFTAPGVEGQTAVLLEAMAVAGVEAEAISYVEAHGTATDLGDSIEVLALSEAFRASTARRGFCALGSAKTNIGHLETAAGIAGLIKTAAALEARELPPSLHFEHPNPKIDFAASPFQVNAALRPWPQPPGGNRRLAGVSSFGIGSTNAHAILEEAPPRAPSEPGAPWQLLMLSARAEAPLETMAHNLGRHLAAHPQLDLADVAHTLGVGRKAFTHRRVLVCRDREAALATLGAGEQGVEARGPDTGAVHDHRAVVPGSDRRVAFLLPGLGEHHVDMGLGLYQREPVFRAVIDRAAACLQPLLGVDLRQVIYPRGVTADERGEEGAGRQAGKGPDLAALLGRARPRDGADEAARTQLDRTALAQPAIFAVEVALAELFLARGIRPRALIGYSLGEWVCACLAGVLSLEDALMLVARRAQLIDALPAGAMLAVPLDEAALMPLLARHGLSLAAVNGITGCVAAGPPPAVAALEATLDGEGVVYRRLPTTHAFHSAMLEPVAAELTALVGTFALQEPTLPWISNVTGTWITHAEATDPAYWARHMCKTVRFAEGIDRLLSDHEELVLLEVGPGQSLTSFTRLHPSCDTTRPVITTLRARHEHTADAATFLTALGELWLAGVEVDWSAHYSAAPRRRVTLPTYPFQRQRYWIELDTTTATGAGSEEPAAGRITLDKQEDLADWLYLPRWEALAATPEPAGAGVWLLLGARQGLVEQLRHAEREVVGVAFDDHYQIADEGAAPWTMRADRAEDYVDLLSTLRAQGRTVRKIVHLGGLSASPGADPYAQAWSQGFVSLLYLAQAVGRLGLGDVDRPLDIVVVTAGAYAIEPDEALCPEGALALGPCRVIPQEFPGVRCRNVDVGVDEPALVEVLEAELKAAEGEEVVAWRGGERLVRRFVRLPAADETAADERSPRLRQGGTYLLTGGRGGLGLALAEHLAAQYGARLVLTGRSPLPEPEAWAGWLAEHGDDDPTSREIRHLQSLEARGAEVLALSADVTDRQQMAGVRDRAVARFGSLHGVVHLAGVPGGGVVQLKTPAGAAAVIDPKVRGALVLAEVLRDVELDFVVLYSSIASILGELGQADYCGANAFLDVFASHWRRRGTLVTTINWDLWQEVGLAVYTEVPEHLRAWRQEMLERGMRSAEGVEVFERILARDTPQVIVSTQELHGRIALGRSFTGERFLRELGGDGGASPGGPPAAPAATKGAALPANRGELEQVVSRVWQRILGRENLQREDNFFDLGGNSLLGLQLVNDLSQELGVQIAAVELFEHPSIAALVGHLQPAVPTATQAVAGGPEPATDDDRIAVVGMAGRFPGARNVDELWHNLQQGVASFTTFEDEELLAAGVDPLLLAASDYVRVGAILDDVEGFDAALFGYSPREAEIMDPQHRLFLECAWEALERAGHDPQRYGGGIGVFGGASINTYVFRFQADPATAPEPLQLIIGNDKDSLTTSVSYKLGLEGPSVGVQTFCSTSLVAVHLAVQSLRNRECAMALAGGVTVTLPQKSGYRYQEGSILSPDGCCRPFDSAAQGTVSGSGVGIVVLKRLSDALADGDTVHAVLRGSAINNDGAVKAGYTAPSVGRQADVVAAALHAAGVGADSIDYIEAHGTGTPLGDPIEVTALTRAFRQSTDACGFCALGSVKSNVGHLDRVSGVTGLIKTVLALEHGQIPPSLHFEAPNPKIDFASSPFFVNTELRPWPATDRPRRAGVSSLGFGGTNAHVILEEAPAAAEPAPCRGPQLLLLSAHTPTALEAATVRLADFLARRPESNLADVAFTLQMGRRQLRHRRAVVASSGEEAEALLRGEAPQPLHTAEADATPRQVVFLFPGQGSQYPGMGRALYRDEPIFRRELDRCAAVLQPLGIDLHELMRLDSGSEEAAAKLAATRFTQPLLFALEYALARTWMAWGITPRAMIGHSVGELVAGCLAEVFSLADALALVVERGRLMQAQAGGDMLSVPLSEEEVRARLQGTTLSLAALNAPDRQVVAGTAEAVADFADRLAADGIDARLLHTSHAFHAASMEPAVEPFTQRCAEVERRAPVIPFISGLTGTWISDEEAVDPGFWAAQLSRPVRFSAGIRQLLSDDTRVFVEVGPGSTLSTLTRRHLEPGRMPTVVASLPGPRQEVEADVALLTALGRLWTAGVPADWPAVHGEGRRRIPLPTYPFEHRRCWVEDPGTQRLPGASRAGRQPREWLFSPAWKSASQPRVAEVESARYEAGWLLLVDEEMEAGPSMARQLAAAVAARVEERGWPVATSFSASHGLPAVVLDLRGLDGHEVSDLLRLATRLDACGRPGSGRALHLWAVTRDLCSILGLEAAAPANAALLAACRAVNRAHPHLLCRHLDIHLSDDGEREVAHCAAQIVAEVLGASEALSIARRGRRRWVPIIEPVVAEEAAEAALPTGTYVMTGALDDPGFGIACSLSKAGARRLVLLEPQPMPPAAAWDGLLEEARPSAAEMNAFLEALAAEEGSGVDMEGRAAGFPHRLQQLATTVEREHIPEDFDALADALCAAYGRRFFAAAVDVGAGRHYTLDALRQELAVVPRFERFFHYLLHVLAKAEMVSLTGEGVTFRAVPPAASDPETLSEQVCARYPALHAGIECVAHCAARYGEAFRGAVEPVSILFPDGDPQMLRQVMETQDRFSINRLFYPLMAETIRQAAAGIGHRPLRILEIGAGDGNLTWELAAALRGTDVEYWFTDIGRAFVVNGRKTAAERELDFMRFGVLDISRDPAEQGFEPYSFDVLVAFDVVHATPRIVDTMQNLQRLLTPGGWTMLLEPTRDQHWISMIWGLAEGWWLYADEDLRSLHPLLTPAQWEGVLSDLTLDYRGVFPLDPAERARADHSLIVAQQPAIPRDEGYRARAAACWQARRRQQAERVRRRQTLTSLGTEVEVLPARLDDAAAVATAAAEVRRRWGTPCGVVHAAEPGGGASAGDLDGVAYTRGVRSSATILDALEAGFEDDPPALAWLVTPFAAATDEASGPQQAVDLYLAARAARPGSLPWRSLAWGVPGGDGVGKGGLAPELGAAALAGFAAWPELPRVLVTPHPPTGMDAAWNRIPAPTPAATGDADAEAVPATAEEKDMAAIWEEVLGIEGVGLHDNFFELGGDSLIATQIHSRIREGLQIDMPVEKLFELPTVAGQAQVVGALRREKEEREHQEIMAVLAQMSDEEAEQVLQEMNAEVPHP